MALTSTAKRRNGVAIVAAVTATTAAIGGTVVALVVGSSDDVVAGEPLTITPNPSYRASEPFQGWGTSLVWFANATGGYPEDAPRGPATSKVFGDDGLNLNDRPVQRRRRQRDRRRHRRTCARAVRSPGWWNPALAASER